MLHRCPRDPPTTELQATHTGSLSCTPIAFRIAVFNVIYTRIYWATLEENSWQYPHFAWNLCY